MGIAPVAEEDRAVLGVQEAFIADGDPMGVRPDRRAPARDQRRGLGVDDPVLGPELREERPEGRRLGERGGLPGEVELSCLEGLLERREVFPPKHHRESPHREEDIGVILFLAVRLGRRDRHAESKRSEGRGRRGAIAR